MSKKEIKYNIVTGNYLFEIKLEVGQMVGFIIGCFFGGFVGMAVMCCCIASKNSDEEK